MWTPSSLKIVRFSIVKQNIFTWDGSVTRFRKSIDAIGKRKTNAVP